LVAQTLRFSPASPSPGRSILLSFGTHLSLPSFPTRRSSDLIFLGQGLLVDGVDDGLQVIAGRSGDDDLLGASIDVSHALDLAGRSEEHTSELQSRFDLVCRLLLEKKQIRQAQAGRTDNAAER